MEHSTSAPNERVLRTTQLAKLSFNHPSVVLTADVFQYFYKNSNMILFYNLTSPIDSILLQKTRIDWTYEFSPEALSVTTYTSVPSTTNATDNEDSRHRHRTY